MSMDRPNVVFIGKVTDRHGFSAELLEDPLTGTSYLAYTPETWWERCEYFARLRASGKSHRSLSGRERDEVVHGQIDPEPGDRGRRH